MVSILITVVVLMICAYGGYEAGYRACNWVLNKIYS